LNATTFRRRAAVGFGVGLSLVAGGVASSQAQDPAGLRSAAQGGRAATIIGARGINWQVANSTIGPLQDQRIFYGGQLPASFAGSEGDRLPAGVTAIISYKTPTTNVASFVRSIPASRPVIMAFHHEPEGGDFPSGPTFVSQFQTQSQLIRSASQPNVRVAMIAGAYQYGSGRNGAAGQYLPAPSYVDMYTVDTYQRHPDGSGLATDANFQGWYNLVKGRGKPLGITEYGLNSDNTAAGNAAQVTTMRADNAWLIAHGPFAVLSYWWSIEKMTVSQAISTSQNWQFTGAASIAEWRAIEAGASPPSATPRPTATTTATPRPSATVRPTPTPSATPTPVPGGGMDLRLAANPTVLTTSSTLAVTLAQPAAVTIDIIGPHGTVVRHRVLARSMGTGTSSIVYFGLDDTLNRLPAGNYVAAAIAVNAQGEVELSTVPLVIAP
jgi:hypothetical protein